LSSNHYRPTNFFSELEAHLLDHKYVGDVCVVPVPDEYSGEIPLAFVVPHASIASKINEDAKEAEKVKAELISVCMTS
jgi:4-coumarate--CoA ligase